MSEKKTIQINPDLFKVSEKTTSRKKHSPPNIKIKSPEKKQKQKTLRKNVLKMIREKQQEEYKRLFEKSETKKTSIGSSSQQEFNKDFDESLEFFSSLASKPENVENIEHNTTFKKYPEMNSVLLQPNTPIFIDTNEIVNTDLPDVFSQNINSKETIQIHQPSIQLPPPPKYGCLKNGSLPTYKTAFRQTQRVYPSTHIQPSSQSYPSSSQSYPSSSQTYQAPKLLGSQQNTPLQFVEREPQKNYTKDPLEIAQKPEKTQGIFNDKSQKRIKYMKRKKIFKRTYHVGRSAIKPQIGVLVSNRTVRNRISTDAQLLKQTPIHDVRKFLIKKGFIKVGTNAPNDVLRKMYESVSMVCGEIQNHNPENLLFNFIHDTVQ
jgi:hypothetical protein